MRTLLRSAAVAVVTLACAVPATAQDAERSPAEQRNLAFVLDFWNNAFMTRNVARFPEFFAADYVDHNPNITTPGLPGLLEYVHKLSTRASAAPQVGAAPRPSGSPPSGSPQSGSPHSDVVHTSVDGEFVTLIRKRTLPDPQDPTKTYEAFGFETVRVHDGKIVEHWDSVLKQGAPQAAAPVPTAPNRR
jgi:predicted SnoaL-like aldol condensation-catalyzing enzyme